ncbi:hypothetical protein [Clostridioides sp. ZZV14-6345]|uniref:hypothetical protein n=1 Tax=Clostridioides sp. ZZV14-6345 TaxID=2811496 RepID=UPI001D101077|nr:hypothetical protein [Clostridioides sp. ZZV14-6345]
MKIEDVMRNAIEWANGKECMELYILDIFIISEYLDIKIPTCFENNFIATKNINQITTTGAEKTIFKILDKIKIKLLKCKMENYL